MQGDDLGFWSMTKRPFVKNEDLTTKKQLVTYPFFVS